MFDVVSKLSELSCHFILILMFVYSKVPSLQTINLEVDRRQYLTIREDGAESPKGLKQIAGSPKYHQILATRLF